MDEAPCPSFAGETPRPFYDKMIDEKDKIIGEKKSTEIEINNKKYIFELGKSENNKNIIFKIYEKKRHIFSNYITYVNYDQFIMINDIFKYYNDLNGVYDLLSKNIEDKKYSIYLEGKENKIIFQFIMPGNKILNVDIYLKEEKVSNTLAINDVYNIIDKLEEDNNNFKEEINQLKNEDKKLRDELNNKNKEIINLKNELIEIKNENKLIKDKIKLIEDNIRNISLNNNSKKDKKYLDDNTKENKIENNIENPNNKETKVDNNKSEYKSIPNENKYNSVPNENKYNSIPNQSEYKSISNNNPNKEINQNNIPRNIIIDEDEEEEEENKNKNLKNNIPINNDLAISKKLNSSPPPQIKKDSNIKLENINIDNIFNSSKIISSKTEKLNLYKWLISKGGNILEIKLIFQSLIDGDSYETFIEKCGDKGPTLSIIRTIDNKRFGGFSKAQWTDKKGKINIKDESAFVYSLDKLEKYDVLKPDIAIACFPDDYLLMYGNGFNRYGLRIFSGFLDKKNYENFNNKSYNTPNEYCLSGRNDFYVKELEIFQIIFK